MGKVSAAGMWMYGSQMWSGRPASSTSTRVSGSADSRFASALRAEPPPTMTKSYISFPLTRLRGALPLLASGAPFRRRLPSSLVPRSSVQAVPRPFGSLELSGLGGGVEVLAHGLGHLVVGSKVTLAVGQGPLQDRDDVAEPAGPVVGGG